ncbi:MAG: MATH domain-containing protein, partial [bacterium]
MPANTRSGQPARQGDAEAMELGLVEEPSLVPIDTMGRLPELSFGMMTPSSEGGDDLGKSQTPGKSISKTVTETITGQHEHTIVGYSLIKGIGDGEPIASERFEVGGHEWVLLFYPDGKRSSAELHTIQNAVHVATAGNAGNAAVAEDGQMQRQTAMTPSPIRAEDGINAQE